MRTEQENEDIGFISEMLAMVADFGCRHPWLVLLGTLLSCVLCLLGTFRYLEFHTQRNDLISPKKTYYQRWQQYVAEFGDDDDMVVVVEGADRARMILALEDLAGEVQKEPALFDRLFYKVDLRPLKRRALLFLSPEEIRRIQDSLKNMSLLLEPPVLGGLDPLFGWKSLTVQHLLHEAERRVAAVKVQKGTSEDDDFLRQLDVICQRGGDYLHDPDAYLNPWQSIMRGENGQEKQLEEPQYFFGQDDALAFLLVRPVKEKEGFTYSQKSILGLREILAEISQRYPDLKIGLTGLPVLENDEMIASRNDSNFASWLALFGVAFLYLLVYRGYRYPLMTVATLVVGTIWAMGWLTLTVGHINILSSAFAVMLIGMGDYGVLWVTRFGQERQEGADLHRATYMTAISVGPGILTAAMTTALAFYATMLADLRAVGELGWIAGSGVLLCALACFLVMPAMLALLDFRPAPKPEADQPVILSLEEAQQGIRQWLPGLTHKPQWVIPVSVGVVALLGYFALGSQYDHNLLKLQARNLDSVQWEQKLIECTNGTSWHALSYTTTPEEALALKARYEKLPEVGRVVEVASLVPRDQEHKLEQLRDIQGRLRRLPERGQTIPHALPHVPGLVLTAQHLIRNLEGMPEERLRGLRQTLEGLVERIQEAGNQAGQLLQEYEEHFTRDLAEDLHRLRAVSKPEPIQVADLPMSLRERYIGKNGKWLLRIFARDCLWEYAPLEKFVARVRTVDSEATGKPFTTLEGLKVMKNGFFLAGIYAGIAMVIVLLLDFGNCKHTVIALAPLFLGLVATLGFMVLCGLALNPANMIAFPLILGVGADNGVHVLHDYRSRPRGRRYSLSYATGRGIMVASLTTILGFGTLIISQHQGLASLGLVLTLGVTCCMLTALVFLPALLRLVSLRGKQKGPRVLGQVSRKSA
jgi:hopanoid biosynthesis associated RND transporter like protein HpnN